MDYLHKKLFFALICATLAVGAGSISAQSLGGGQIQPIQYIIAPENPGPNTLVHIEAQGIGNFLGNSTLTWRKNGITVLSGVGARDFSFTTGALGVPVIISLSIDSTEYGLIERSFTFNPSQTSLVWEANTTVPPFYMGKALASAGSTVKVAAFPTVIVDGAATPASGLSFQWKLNDDLAPAQSGLGQNVFTFKSNQLHPSETVSVDVLSGTSVVGRASIVIPASQPLLVLYVHDPLQGILYNRALGSSFQMPALETTVRAEPYFFSLESRARGTLQYSWQLNGQDASGPSAALGELTLRQTGEGQGSAALLVSLQNNDLNKLLQAAQSALSVSFGGQNRSSLFGL